MSAETTVTSNLSGRKDSRRGFEGTENFNENITQFVALSSSPSRALRARRVDNVGMTAEARRPRLEIEYRTQCRWLLRAGWMAQELLTTFPADLGEVALVPGTGGVFEIRLDGETIWSRAAEAGFPELPVLKQLVRDRIAPGRALGHSDRRE